MLNKAKIVGFVLTLVFLALALWKVDRNELVQTLSAADYRFVAPAAIITLLGYVSRTYRWKQILNPTQRIPTRRLFPVLMIGFMANNILPARIGEFVRAYTLSRQENVQKSVGLATVLVERLCDGLTLILFLAIISFAFPLPEQGAEVGYVASGAFLAFAGLILVLLLREDVTARVIDLFTQPLSPRWRSWALQKVAFFVDGLRALQQRRALIAIVVVSLLIWVFEGTSYYLIVLGFAVPLAPWNLFLAVVFLLVMVNLSTMVPSSPGFVGAFEAAAWLALGAFGVKREIALSIAIVSHTMQYLLVTGIGLFFFWRQHLSLRRVGEDALNETNPLSLTGRKLEPVLSEEKE